MTTLQLELFLCTLLVAWAAVHAAMKARRRAAVPLPDVAFWASALYFGAGPLVACYYRGGSLPEVSADILMLSYAGVALHMLGLLLVGRWMRHNSASGPRAGSSAAFFRRSANVDPRVVVVSLGLVWGFNAYMAVEYGVLFSGTLSERVHDLSYVVYASVQLTALIGVGCLVWSSGALFSKRLVRYLAFLVFLVQGGLAFLQGRTGVLYLAVFVLFGAVSTHRGLRAKHVLAVGLAATVMAVWLFPAFIALRAAHDRAPSRGQLRGVREAIDDLRGQSREAGDGAYRTNMGTRPLIVRFNCDIIERQRLWGPMWGDALMSTVRWFLPSGLLPDKTRALQTEPKISHHYALPMVDRSSNWPAFGCADFGPLGGLLTGLLMGWVLMMIERVALRAQQHYPFYAMCMFGGGMFIALAVEVDLTATWVALRNLVFLFGFAALFRLLGGTAQASRGPLDPTAKEIQ